ncbi:MAG: hypothetical protein ACP5OB_05780 [Candidatus Ratteibacteria bacterium]
MEKALIFLSFFLGFLSVVVAIVLPLALGERTDELIRTEDERAKKMIDEGNKRVEELIKEIDKRHQETLYYLGTLIKSEDKKQKS